MRLYLALAVLAVLHTPSLAQEAKSLGETKTLSPDQQSDGIWKQSEVDPVERKIQNKSTGKEETQKVAFVIEKRISMPQGAVIFSQLVDEKCSPNECPTRVILNTAQGAEKILFDNQAQQINVDSQDKGLSEVQVSVSADLKKMYIKAGDSTLEYDLNP